MSHNARIILPLAILALLFIGIAVYLNSSSSTSNREDQAEPVQSEDITNPNAESGLKAISRYNSDSQEIDIYLSPVGNSHSFNSMALSIAYDGSDLTSKTSQPTLSDEFKSSPWSSPFADVEDATSNQIVLNLALLNSSPKPFILDKEVKLASISIESVSPETITATIDPAVSQLFNLDGIEYQFDRTGETTSVEDGD